MLVQIKLKNGKIYHSENTLRVDYIKEAVKIETVDSVVKDEVIKIKLSDIDSMIILHEKVK